MKVDLDFINKRNEWLKNNKIALNDVAYTISTYRVKASLIIDNVNVENIVYQYKDSLERFEKLFVFISDNWEYERNNNYVFTLVNQSLWSLLKEMSALSFNIWESTGKPENDKYLGFMRNLRNIMSHKKLAGISLKKLHNSISTMNDEIASNSNQFLINKMLSNSGTVWYNDDQYGYLSFCKFVYSNSVFDSNNALDNLHIKIKNPDEISEDYIQYYLTNFSLPNGDERGELNSADNFIAYPFITRNYVIRIKLIPVLYWSLEKNLEYIMKFYRNQ